MRLSKKLKALGRGHFFSSQHITAAPTVPIAAGQDVVVTINGILGTSTGWEAMAANWGNAHTRQAWYGYFNQEGLFPLFQSTDARALADYLSGLQAQMSLGAQMHVIAHSDGAKLFMAMLDANPGLLFGKVALLGAALPDDCGQSGINAALAISQVDQFILGVSPDDDVLGWTWADLCFWNDRLGLDGPSNYVAPDKAQPTFATCAVDDLRVMAQADNPLIVAAGSCTHCGWVYADSACTVLNTAVIGSLAYVFSS
jgi:hypothetical protein